MTIAQKLRHLAEMSEQNPDDWTRIRWRLLVVLHDGDRAEDAKHPGRAIDEMLGKSDPADWDQNEDERGFWR